MNENTARKPLQSTNQSRTLSLFKDVAIVIIGALLALAADDWRENREQDELDMHVVRMIQGELQSNLDNLRAAGDYHQTTYDALDLSATTLREEGRFELPPNWNDVNPIPTINAAFELALLNGTLSRLDPTTQLELSKLYDSLATYDDRREQTRLATLQTSFTDGNRFFSLKRVALKDEINYQTEMESRYLKVISLLDNKLNP